MEFDNPLLGLLFWSRLFANFAVGSSCTKAVVSMVTCLLLIRLVDSQYVGSSGNSRCKMLMSDRYSCQSTWCSK